MFGATSKATYTNNMNAEICELTKNNIDSDAIKRAGEIIRNGGLVVFPTETVYGLGGDGLNPLSSKKIYAAKGRPSDNPLIVHISDIKDIDKIAIDIPKTFYVLAEEFWPGPLTMILKASDNVPRETTGGLDTVAVRFPSHPIAKAFIEAAGSYIAAPSANLSGRPSPTKSSHVIEDLADRVDMILTCDDIEIGLESTIVDLTAEKPMILRPGYITKEMLEEVLGEVQVDPTLMDVGCTQRPKAPGMRYRHYAPKGDMTLYKGSSKWVKEEIVKATNKAIEEGHKCGIMTAHEDYDYYREKLKADEEKLVIVDLGSIGNMEAIASNVYKALRYFDTVKADVISSEYFDRHGLGEAVMNRLLKAAGHHIIEEVL